LIAFGVAALLSTAFGFLLYVNEDLRRSTFALIVEEETEDGEKVRKIKIERPEPNKEQVREIARNREKQKRKELERKAKEIREVLIEIERAAEIRKRELDSETAWSRLAQMAFRLERLTQDLHPVLTRQRQFRETPALKEDAARIRTLAKRNADSMRKLGSEDLALEGALAQLSDTEELAAQTTTMRSILSELYEGFSSNEQRRAAYGINLAEKVDTTAAEYLAELSRLIYQDPALADAGEGLTDKSVEDARDLGESLASTEEESAPPFESSAPSEEALESMATGELYQSIQEMTQAVDEAFTENRAAELAEVEKIPLEAARDQIYRPQTDTGPDLAEKLDGEAPSNLEEYNAFNETLDQAAQAAEQMARTAESRRDQVAGTQGEAAENTRTAEEMRQALQDRAALRGQMAMAADNRGRVKGNVQDMRAMMAQAYQGGGSQNTPQGMGGEIRTTNTFSQSSKKTPEKVRLDLDKVLDNAIPSRRLDQTSERQGWIFLDTWYVIGPWNRPKGVTFADKFPPETLVDIDATYTGKKDAQLRWRFVQTENIRINPPDEAGDAIYYAYTEVFSERQREVVVAVASDDLAKVWINDLVVWQDSGFSGWRVDEGFRRILLKPGYNEVLVRLESGPGVCHFSVLMCPVDALM